MTVLVQYHKDIDVCCNSFTKSGNGRTCCVLSAHFHILFPICQQKYRGGQCE